MTLRVLGSNSVDNGEQGLDYGDRDELEREPVVGFAFIS